MVILHIASIAEDKTNGVCVVVPEHILAQSEYAEVAFVNVNNNKIESLKDYQIFVDGGFDICKLPEGFSHPDLVVIHEVYCPKFLAISRNLRKNRIPYIVVPHGELSTTAQRKKFLKKKIANILLFNKFVRGAEALQCLSQYELDTTKFRLKKILGTNGVRIPEKVKTSFNEHKTDFLYIGRLDAFHKGLDILIEAVAKEKEFLRANNCRFHIYGPDIKGRFAHLQELIRKHNTEELVDLNYAVLGEAKEKLLLDADIFVQTSRFEGMPVGILEALSYGLPCLVTRGTVLGDIIKDADAGWMAETSVQSVAEKIVAAVKDREKYEEKSKNAIHLVRANYDWKVLLKETTEKYKKLAY